jgi:hypothetical protein
MQYLNPKTPTIDIEKYEGKKIDRRCGGKEMKCPSPGLAEQSFAQPATKP